MTYEYVTYEMFGVNSAKKYFNVADGKYYLDQDFTNEYTHNDGEEIRAAHNYANTYNIPVINLSGEYVLTEPLIIDIKTNTEWGGSVFHVNEAKSNVSKPWFIVKNSEEVIDLTDVKDSNDVYLKTLLLPKVYIGNSIISELSAYRNHLIVIESTDDSDKVGNRNVESPYYHSKKEFFYVDKKGKLIGDITYNFNAITSIKAYPVGGYLTINGGSWYLNGVSNGTDKGIYDAAPLKVTRSRTKVTNQLVKLEDGAMDARSNGVFGFYGFENVYDITLSNIKLTSRDSSQGGSSYGIYADTALKLTIENVKCEGSANDWGIMGTNYVKDLYIVNSNLNRIDTHYHAWNVTVKDTVIGYGGLKLTGGGTLTLDNVTAQSSDRRYINFRSDYGSNWNGDIIVKNALFKIYESSTTTAVYFMEFSPVNTDFDYYEPLYFGRNIYVENVVFDFTGVNSTLINDVPFKEKLVAALISVPTNGYYTKEDNVTKSRFNFPSNISFKNVSVVGRETGVKAIPSINPREYQLPKQGGYDANSIVTNCYMKFENIDSYENTSVNMSSGYHGFLSFSRLLADSYTDNYSLYPKIEIKNCRKSFYLYFTDAVIDLIVKDSVISGINGCSVEGTPGRLRSYFNNCIMKLQAPDTTKTIFRLLQYYSHTFDNCLFRAPIINGEVNTSLTALNLYYVLKPNSYVYFNHVNSKFDSDILSAINLKSEYLSMMKVHHEKENNKMFLRVGTTVERPDFTSTDDYSGFMYFDTDLNKPIWRSSTNTEWKDAVGNRV